MDKNILWSIRLGFSSKQALEIKDKGIKKFLETSFETSIDENPPLFLEDDPKTVINIRAFRKRINKASTNDEKRALRNQVLNTNELRLWWVDKMRQSSFPFREKMVCFWHNHFVATGKKVKLNYWVYQHHMVLQKHAFGNFKDLTKRIVKSNAMVRYLDNVDNRNGKVNENLSRELLELFTLGIGNYSEQDIKDGAKALAGLNLGDHEAKYKKQWENNEEITYLGKTGRFKVDALIDIIFEHENIPYLITRKILKWFIYDDPKEELVKYYGDYFRDVNFEMKPFLIKIVTEEYAKNNSGSKIKDPLVFILQLTNELQLDDEIKSKDIIFFLKQQGMELFDQPNVKGWDGGTSWLTSQTYLQRTKIADLLCNGKPINKRGLQMVNNLRMHKGEKRFPKINLSPDAIDNKKIIEALSKRLLFAVDSETQMDMETILKYDFNPQQDNAQQAVLRLLNYIIKTPEFQII